MRAPDLPLYSVLEAASGEMSVVGIAEEFCSNCVRLVIYSIEVCVIVNNYHELLPPASESEFHV